jgi:hypothetical protein
MYSSVPSNPVDFSSLGHEYRFRCLQGILIFEARAPFSTAMGGSLFFTPSYDSEVITGGHVILILPAALLDLRKIPQAQSAKLSQNLSSSNHIVKLKAKMLPPETALQGSVFIKFQPGGN